MKGSHDAMSDDILDFRSTGDIYREHYDAALGYLAHADELENPGEAIAVAQVRATLALAVAVTRMVDSYNGWKDAGR